MLAATSSNLLQDRRDITIPPKNAFSNRRIVLFSGFQHNEFACPDISTLR
jgi:hypothetical protein